MDRTLLALAAVGLLAPALAGCIDASALAFGDDRTTIFVPALKHGQVTTTQADMLSFTVSSSGPPQSRVFPVQTVETVLAGVHEDLDRYAQPVQALWIETESHAPEWRPDYVEETWASRKAIESEGGNVLYHGTSSPWTWSIESSSAFGDAAFDEWCSGDFEVPGGVPYFASKPVRYDRGQILGVGLTAGEDVVREYDAELWYDVDDYRQAHVTLNWEAVAEDSIELLVDGKARKVPAFEYRLSSEVDFEGEDERAVESGHEPAAAADEKDTRPRVWFADGVPTPVRVVSEFSFDNQEFVLERRVTAFESGSAPLDVGSGEPVAMFEGTHPHATLGEWGFAPDASGLGLALPFEDAMTVLREDPRALDAAVWFEQNPDAFLIDAEYTRDAANDTFVWELGFSNGADYLMATVTRSEPVLPVLPRDEPSGIHVWEDYPRAMPPAEMRGLAVTDAATAMSVAKTFLPHGEDWYSFTMQISGYQRDGEWLYGPDTMYSLSLGGHAEKGDLFSSYSKDWRMPIVTVEGATGGLGGGGGASLSCGGGGFGLPPLVTA